MANFLTGCEIYLTLDGDFIDDINGYNGVPFGTPFSFDSFAYRGQSALFNGVDQYVFSNTGPSIIADEWTISLWMRIQTDSENDNGIIFSFGGENDGFGISVSSSEGYGLTPYGLSSYGDVDVIYCVYPGIGFFNTEVALRRYGLWNHVVLRRDGIVTELFVNGVKTSFSLGDSPNIPSESWFMGAITMSGSPLYFYEGSVDDVQVYPRSLTDDEIIELFNGNKLLKFQKYNRKPVDFSTFLKKSYNTKAKNIKEPKFKDFYSHSFEAIVRYTYKDFDSHSLNDIKTRENAVDHTRTKALDIEIRERAVDHIRTKALDIEIREKAVDHTRTSAISKENKLENVQNYSFSRGYKDKDVRSDSFVAIDTFRIYEATETQWEEIQKNQNIRLFEKQFDEIDLNRSYLFTKQEFIDFLVHAVEVPDEEPDSDRKVISVVDFMLSNAQAIVDYAFDDLYVETNNSKEIIDYDFKDDFGDNNPSKEIIDYDFKDDFGDTDNRKTFDVKEMSDWDYDNIKTVDIKSFTDNAKGDNKPLTFDFVVDFSRNGKPEIFGLQFWSETVVSNTYNAIPNVYDVIGYFEHDKASDFPDYSIADVHNKDVDIKYVDIPKPIHTYEPRFVDYPKEYWKEIIIKFLDIPIENKKQIIDTEFVDTVIEKFKLTKNGQDFIKRINKMTKAEKYEFIKRFDALKFKINKYERISGINKRILVVCPPWREE